MQKKGKTQTNYWGAGIVFKRLYRHVFFVFCSYIDQGKNPNLYTKDCLEKALAKNELVKGKMDNLKVRVSSPSRKPYVKGLTERHIVQYLSSFYTDYSSCDL